jgi:hypothetical protein
MSPLSEKIVSNCQVELQSLITSLVHSKVSLFDIFSTLCSTLYGTSYQPFLPTHLLSKNREVEEFLFLNFFLYSLKRETEYVPRAFWKQELTGNGLTWELLCPSWPPQEVSLRSSKEGMYISLKCETDHFDFYLYPSDSLLGKKYYLTDTQREKTVIYLSSEIDGTYEYNFYSEVSGLWEAGNQLQLFFPPHVRSLCLTYYY